MDWTISNSDNHRQVVLKIPNAVNFYYSSSCFVDPNHEGIFIPTSLL